METEKYLANSFKLGDVSFNWCYASEDDQDALTTDPDELIDSEDSEGIGGDEEDIFRNLLSRAGFHLTYGDNPSQPQVTLREKAADGCWRHCWFSDWTPCLSR
ncbi:hypothetical protein GBA52_001026 [Prunus armeniaca]|nr:hypothetical protein GBA52_001026 [Prunus armeniaca]